MNLPPPARLAVVMQATAAAREKAEAWHAAFVGLGREITPSDQIRIGNAHGVSTRTVRRQWAAWCAGGRDAAALLDRRLTPDRDRASVTPEFIEFWRGLCVQNARKIQPAHRHLTRLWRDGQPIPGVPPWVERGYTLPRGYSLANLRRHAPTPFELTASRVGRQAAAVYRPLVLTSRVGMEVGQQYMVDDVWHDFEVAIIGQRRPSRLLQLHFHDVFSACQFARGIKPRQEDPETGRRISLNAGDMLFLTAHALGDYGFHPSGCVLLLENGTATLTDREAALIAELTGGIVTCQYADIQSAAAYAGQYAGRGKGNFRFKASLESAHNLLHNETANVLDFPAQTGSNSRLNAPEQLHGQAMALDVIQRAILALPPAVVAELRMSHMEATRAIWAVEQICERINRRTEHDLEGWLEAGLTVMEYLLPGDIRVPAAKVASLPTEKRLAVEAVAQPMPRRLSPREVFDAGRAKLVRLRPEQSARLLVGTCGREVTVRHNHLVEFEDRAISPSPLRYLAATLAPGDKYRAVVNPFSPEVCHLFDARDRWHGTLRSWGPVSRIDAEALKERISAASQIANTLLQPLARAGAEITRRRAEDLEHNAQVIADHHQATADLGAQADAGLRNLF